MTDSTHRRPVRILQTSDVHLGPPAREPDGREHVGECICPVDVMVELVREHAVDVLLIVGDLFDHARVSESLVARTFERLADVDADVVLLPGNHDQYDHTAVCKRQRGAIDEARVHFFDELDGTVVDVAGGALRLWARAMDEHTPSFLPLAGAPAHPGDRWYVAAAHGHYVDPGGDIHRSSRLTAAEIDAVGADYIALGHWHVTTDLSARGVATPAWYSGAPLFGHGAGRMLLVDLVPGQGPEVTPVHVLDHPAGLCAAPASLS